MKKQEKEIINKKEDLETNFKQGSHAQQVLDLNKRIKKLTEHLKTFKKDNVTKLSLFKLVSKRKRFLKYLKKNNQSHYLILQNIQEQEKRKN